MTPIIDLMAISNAHFAKLRDFITSTHLRFVLPKLWTRLSSLRQVWAACRRPTWEPAEYAASWGSAVLYLGVWNQPRALDKTPKGSDAQSAWEPLL